MKHATTSLTKKLLLTPHSISISTPVYLGILQQHDPPFRFPKEAPPPPISMQCDQTHLRGGVPVRQARVWRCWQTRLRGKGAEFHHKTCCWTSLLMLAVKCVFHHIVHCLDQAVSTHQLLQCLQL